MFERLGRATVLVDDYDEALAFYEGVLEFEVIFDGEVGDGLRVVHVGVPGQTADGIGLWLLEPATDTGRERVGSQTGGEPAFVLYTDDCHGTFETLDERGVVFHVEPSIQGSDVVAHFSDPYGTRFVLVELGSESE